MEGEACSSSLFFFLLQFMLAFERDIHLPLPLFPILRLLSSPPSPPSPPFFLFLCLPIFVFLLSHILLLRNLLLFVVVLADEEEKKARRKEEGGENERRSLFRLLSPLPPLSFSEMSCRASPSSFSPLFSRTGKKSLSSHLVPNRLFLSSFFFLLS